MLTSRFSPKLLYMRGLLANLVLFFLMGFTSDLRVLLVLRILQGVFGGISTVGLLIISSSSSQEKISSDIGFFQTFQTMGFLVGPPMGAFACIGIRLSGRLRQRFGDSLCRSGFLSSLRERGFSSTRERELLWTEQHEPANGHGMVALLYGHGSINVFAEYPS
jgi:MFS family permease